MHPFVYATVALFFTSVGVTLYAVMTAEEGYEDRDGFHAVKRGKTVSRRAKAGHDDKDESLPPVPVH